MFSLAGQRALIVGIANDRSLAYGCARWLRQAGAELAITYLNDKARPYVEPLARQLEASIFAPLDVTQPEQFDQLFSLIDQHWGGLETVVHSIAFANREDLHGPLLECSASGFGLAMDVSCHSLLRLARWAAPRMPAGGAITTMTFLGARRVISNYGVMGPVKAALEATVRQLAVELGPRRIRVNAISAGPVKTRAASGIKDFEQLWQQASDELPLGEAITPDDIGATCTWLSSPAAAHITGTILPVDSGWEIVG
jgi:enoyl-[acyl-carrier protein] reductase I